MASSEENRNRLLKLTLPELRDLASSHPEVQNYSSLNKEALADLLNDNGVEPAWPEAEDAEDEVTVSGFQEGVFHPNIPQTREEFAKLLDNPDKPAENQAAPSQENLNPHLFGPQGRL